MSVLEPIPSGLHHVKFMVWLVSDPRSRHIASRRRYPVARAHASKVRWLLNNGLIDVRGVPSRRMMLNRFNLTEKGREDVRRYRRFKERRRNRINHLVMSQQDYEMAIVGGTS